MTTEMHGRLEIDHDRGVIYFHCDENSLPDTGLPTLLRIQGLPAPIPAVLLDDMTATQQEHKSCLDINVQSGLTSWK